MCLSIPGKVVHIKGELATVSIGGSMVETSIALVDDVQPGEYVLVHSGFALQRISDEEARETLRLIEELGEMPEFPTPENPSAR